MSVMRRIRLFHTLLALGTIAAYLSGEFGIIHAWLGYGIAVLLLIRLMLALGGAPQLGLQRYAPHFAGINLGSALTHPVISRLLLAGIALALAGVTATGIMMDRGRSLSLASPVVEARAEGSEEERHAAESGADVMRESDTEEEGEDAAEELHETLANLLMGLVALHVTYLFAFKRPLARFMLFLGQPARS